MPDLKKQCVEEWIQLVMLAAGYHPVDAEQRNWSYRIKSTVPGRPANIWTGHFGYFPLPEEGTERFFELLQQCKEAGIHVFLPDPLPADEVDLT